MPKQVTGLDDCNADSLGSNTGDDNSLDIFIGSVTVNSCSKNVPWRWKEFNYKKALLSYACIFFMMYTFSEMFKVDHFG
jgi:hypothetical protein